MVLARQRGNAVFVLKLHPANNAPAGIRGPCHRPKKLWAYERYAQFNETVTTKCSPQCPAGGVLAQEEGNKKWSHRSVVNNDTIWRQVRESKEDNAFASTGPFRTTG
jgi:hypothetical protein